MFFLKPTLPKSRLSTQTVLSSGHLTLREKKKQEQQKQRTQSKKLEILLGDCSSNFVELVRGANQLV